jgi:hypothetical protein
MAMTVKEQRDCIECVIDQIGLSATLMLVAEICGDKAAHIADNWQDTTLAKVWINDARVVEQACVLVESDANGIARYMAAKD